LTNAARGPQPKSSSAALCARGRVAGFQSKGAKLQGRKGNAMDFAVPGAFFSLRLYALAPWRFFPSLGRLNYL
jgi:hypothetical protein